MRLATLTLVTVVVTLCAASADASMIGSASDVKESRSVVKLQPGNQFSLERLTEILAVDIVAWADPRFGYADTTLVAGKKKDNKDKKDKDKEKDKDKDKDKKSPEDDDDD